MSALPDPPAPASPDSAAADDSAPATHDSAAVTDDNSAADDDPAQKAPLPLIRPATPEDAGALAELFWQVRTESVPSIPMIVHPRESVLPFVETVLLREFEVWVAQDGDTLVGFLALMPPDQLGHLYITAGFTGRGLGTQLLGLAKTRFPDGLQLWAFQSNEGALRFYERHGFEPVEWTEGDNEEHAPDVRMVWKPAAGD